MTLTAIVAAGCSSADPGAAPSDLDLSASCQLQTEVDAPTIVLAHPDGWRLDDCARFDPGAGEPDAATEDTAVDVSWTVVDQDYRTATDLSRDSQVDELPTVHDRVTSVVSGHQAVRFVTERSGEHGPWVEGTETTQWFVDLDLGGEAAGSRPVLVGTAAATDGVDYAAAVDVLDTMAHEVEIDDRPQPDGVVVARTERGTSPWEVVHEDGCLRLIALEQDRQPVDEACDLAQEGLAAVQLQAEPMELPVLAGTAPADTAVVGFDESAHTDGLTAGAVPLPDGRTGFAFPYPADQPGTLLARTIDDEDVASVTVEPTDTP